MFNQQSAYPFHINFFTVYRPTACKLRQT